MAEKLDPKELVSFKELLMSEVIQSEALFNVLERREIVSKQELLNEIKRVQKWGGIEFILRKRGSLLKNPSF
jgi:hypothetical protein